MIRAAVGFVEAYQRRQLLTATYTAYLENWPSGDTIEIRDKLPIASITAVKYKADDDDGTLTTITSTNYGTRLPYASPAWIKFIDGYSYPTLKTGAVERIQISLTAGYGTADQIPWTTRAAIRMLVSDFVDERGTVIIGTTANEIPNKLKRCLDPECWTISGY